ncbi:hypothetical protein LTR37_020539 [Vermiconidia calcicola]|uniref:Uncharacterized protein n=1 Tax=Vermiconidia calcicola TaxID=1690605 RepID=A0ACC3MCY0_9PEZI|nr:hypothetical protein LTR37_020539 [Vermiconidia calcicola]
MAQQTTGRTASISSRSSDSRPPPIPLRAQGPRRLRRTGDRSICETDMQRPVSGLSPDTPEYLASSSSGSSDIQAEKQIRIDSANQGREMPVLRNPSHDDAAVEGQSNFTSRREFRDSLLLPNATPRVEPLLPEKADWNDSSLQRLRSFRFGGRGERTQPMLRSVEADILRQFGSGEAIEANQKMSVTAEMEHDDEPVSPKHVPSLSEWSRGDATSRRRGIFNFREMQRQPQDYPREVLPVPQIVRAEGAGAQHFGLVWSSCDQVENDEPSRSYNNGKNMFIFGKPAERESSPKAKRLKRKGTLANLREGISNMGMPNKLRQLIGRKRSRRESVEDEHEESPNKVPRLHCDTPPCSELPAAVDTEMQQLQQQLEGQRLEEEQLLEQQQEEADPVENRLMSDEDNASLYPPTTYSPVRPNPFQHDETLAMLEGRQSREPSPAPTWMAAAASLAWVSRWAGRDADDFRRFVDAAESDNWEMDMS